MTGADEASKSLAKSECGTSNLKSECVKLGEGSCDDTPQVHDWAGAGVSPCAPMWHDVWVPAALTCARCAIIGHRPLAQQEADPQHEPEPPQ